MSSTNVSFKNDRNIELPGILDHENVSNGHGVILCTHFTGIKEHKHLHNLAKALASAGIAALRFDYSDCVNKSEGSCENMMLSHQVRDVFAAVDFMESQGFKRIGIMGHSLGGTTAIVAAANDPRIKVLVPVAASANLKWDVLFKERVSEWKRKGYITFPSWRGNIRINYGFYKDLKKYDASRIISSFFGPVRIIHPGEDELVSINNAKLLFKNANNPKDLKLVEGSDHMFSKKEHENEMIKLCVEWFNEYL